MSFMLPVNFCLIYKLIQCSAIAFIYQFESWCLELPIADNEDTHPIISQNKLDGICLKTCCVIKITTLDYCKLGGLERSFLVNV